MVRSAIDDIWRCHFCGLHFNLIDNLIDLRIEEGAIPVLLSFIFFEAVELFKPSFFQKPGHFLAHHLIGMFGVENFDLLFVSFLIFGDVVGKDIHEVLALYDLLFSGTLHHIHEILNEKNELIR